VSNLFSLSFGLHPKMSLVRILSCWNSSINLWMLQLVGSWCQFELEKTLALFDFSIYLFVNDHIDMSG